MRHRIGSLVVALLAFPFACGSLSYAEERAPHPESRPEAVEIAPAPADVSIANGSIKLTADRLILHGGDDESPSPQRVTGHGIDSNARVTGSIVLNKVADPESAPRSAEQVQLDVRLLNIDWRKVQKTQIDLDRLLRGFMSGDSGQRSPKKPKKLLTQGLLRHDDAENLVRLLAASGVVTMRAAPALLTVDNQEARFHIGGTIAIPVPETANGRTRIRMESVDLGVAVQATPEVLSDTRIKLELGITARNNRPVRTQRSGDQGQRPPRLRTRNYRTAAVLQNGQTLVLSEKRTRAPSNDSAKESRKKGVMLLVTPTRVKSSKTVADGSVEEVKAGAARAGGNPDAGVSPDLRRSIRELRREVHGLRRDVHRLHKLHESSESVADKHDPEPPVTWTNLPRVHKPGDAGSTDETKRIQKNLETELSLQCDDEPLENVVKTLAAAADVNFVIENRGLEEVGITAETPVSINVTDMTCRKALNFLLEPLSLASTVDHNVVKITSRRRSEGPLKVVTYNVADLIVASPAEEAEAATLDSLTDLIASTVRPESWLGVGGHGSIKPYETTLSLVVRQTQPVHEEIRDLLEQLRRTRDVQVELQSRLLIVPGEIWSKLRDRDDLRETVTQLANGSGQTQLGHERYEQLVGGVESESRANLIDIGTRTLHNGHSTDLSRSLARVISDDEKKKPALIRTGGRVFPVVDSDGRANAPSLMLTAATSPDRRRVHLHLAAGTQGSPASKRRHTISAQVADGEGLLVDLTGRINAAVGEPGDKLLLLVKPEIIVREEEELLGIPQSSR